MNKIGLKLSRYIISHIPKGKSFGIRLATSLFGDRFNDTITVKDGRKFSIGKISLVKQHLFFLNIYEDFETHVIEKVIEPGDYVFDVGASFGWFTTLMSSVVGNSGRVFAFELVPSIAEECRQSIRLNNQEQNVTIEEIGLAETDDEVDYHYSETLGLGNLKLEGFTGGGILKTGKSRITTLDHYVEEKSIPKVNFIKCDVDGAEVLFLKGAKKTLTEQKPIIIIEASGAHGRSSCREIFEELTPHKYRFFSMHHKKLLREVNQSEFSGKFKENILCLPDNKLSLLKILY